VIPIDKLEETERTVNALGKRYRDDVSDSTTEDPEEAGENKRRRT
jgi:hypothetical protein